MTTKIGTATIQSAIEHEKIHGDINQKESIQPPAFHEPAPPNSLDRLSTIQPLSQQPEPIQKFKKEFSSSWYGIINSCHPFKKEYCRFGVIDPWLAYGDVVLVTGYNRNCGFINKLGRSLYDDNPFFGFSLRYQIKEVVYDMGDRRLFENSPATCVGMCSNVPFDMKRQEDKERFMNIVREIKKNKNAVVCSFNNDYDFLRQMNCWDSIIEIRRGRRIQNGSESYTVCNVKFLRARHLPDSLRNMTFNMVIHIPIQTTGYDATKDIYFVKHENGYEKLKNDIIQLFNLGRTSREIKQILATENKIDISLPMLNKLKREWGLRSYKPEKKPRKRKKTVDQMVSPVSSAQMNS